MESHKRKDSSLMEHLEEIMVTFENCWVNVKHWKKLVDKLREGVGFDIFLAQAYAYPSSKGRAT